MKPIDLAHRALHHTLGARIAVDTHDYRLARAQIGKAQADLAALLARLPDPDGKRTPVRASEGVKATASHLSPALTTQEDE